MVGLAAVNLSTLLRAHGPDTGADGTLEAAIAELMAQERDASGSRP